MQYIIAFKSANVSPFLLKDESFIRHVETYF